MALPNEIDFMIKVESGKELVDMNYALDTMKGFSATISAVTEGALSDNFKSRSSTADDIRTELLEAFLGSYVQKFRLKIKDKEKEDKLRKLSNSVLTELITYYVNEVLHSKQGKLSLKAEKKIKKLEKIESQIIDRISSWVKEMHSLSMRRDYSVKLFRLTDQKKYQMFEVNKASYGNAFELCEDQDYIEIDAVISRFNIFTGNGRLLMDGQNATLPFGFAGSYSKVRQGFKKTVSKNLSRNTAVDDDKLVQLRLKVKAKRNKSNEIVKYMIYKVNP